jgi:hypothetical protein
MKPSEPKHPWTTQSIIRPREASSELPWWLAALQDPHDYAIGNLETLVNSKPLDLENKAKRLG